MSKSLGGNIGWRDNITSNGLVPSVVALGQQYNIGEKPTVILYAYINHHAETPKYRQKHTMNLEPGFYSTPVVQLVASKPSARWDVSSSPGNWNFSSPKKKSTTSSSPKKKNAQQVKWRTSKSLVHKIRLHGRRGKIAAKSFSREKLRQAPQKEGG